jgi:hypothetical protein
MTKYSDFLQMALTIQIKMVQKLFMDEFPLALLANKEIDHCDAYIEHNCR